ncbi:MULTISPECIES: hypothetical protein [Rhizobium/Agrobacterium group]|uniref:hypothetical protein n=1 Tax=Rhizobium/Agrobacterium group TaxID=227290 RepID=UPI00107F4459|nr:MULTISPECIES: hypothetical protein [Rhizobium/Agrobacterium group]MBB4402945.1 hypothetical protein [Agrobacterium radiobacter]MBB5589144.1 hypothetical protein [Agrobacterium radiobacter]TGE85725.1 hypothetical protein C9418_25475 [Rhizobium sp. SEMIA 4032]
MEKIVQVYTPEQVRNFFARSDLLDRMTLRPLSHITTSWECAWNRETDQYEPEVDSFAADLNAVIDLVATCERPARYHDHEDTLAERTLRELKWPIQKKGAQWHGADYQAVLEQGAFGDVGQQDLIAAAAGRVHAAMDFGQLHFDDMEERHLNMLAALITIIIFHRDCDGSSLRVAEDTD